MNEFVLMLVIIPTLIVVLLAGYYAGTLSGSYELKKAQYELNTTRRVQHNLNCLVGDLKYEVSQLKPDAAAFKAVKGWWATDQPHIIRHHDKKERFMHIGYPEHKL